MIENKSLYIPLYEFRCDLNLLNEIKEIALSLEYKKDTLYNNGDVSKDKFHHELLFKWFNECLTYVKNIYLKDDIELRITSCWINRCKKTNRIHSHIHKNSIVSGVLYLDTDDNPGTTFYYPNPWTYYDNNNFLTLSKSENSTYIKTTSTPEVGKLILFPSSVPHHVKPVTSSNTRYTCSFNTFIKGTLEKDNISSYLDI